jgi:preprotein translocase subunit SecB
MNELNEVPTSGFRLLRVVTIHQEYSIVSGEEIASETEARGLTVNWDWSVSKDRQFDVFLGADLAGNQEAPETVNVGVIGEFAIAGVATSMAVRSFVQTAAPAIMFPYLRQIISDLTGRGPYGPYYLPSVNVVRMMQRYDFEATRGAHQLRENQELARIYGWPSDLQLALPTGQTHAETR